MPINLTISADNVQEFDTLLARFVRTPSTAIMPEIAHTPAAQEAAAAAEPAPKGNARSRKPKDVAQGEPSSAANATEAQPESGAEPASAAVDPFAAPGAAPAAAASQESAASPAETTGTPAATSPADQAAADAGEVTIQQLKDAMADLLKAKSASFAMQTLEAATGCKSLTSGSPNVVEKAKDDPTIMRRTLDALVAAKSAA